MPTTAPENQQISQLIGQLSGEVRSMHAGMIAQLEHIREDMRRIEDASNKRIERLEDKLVAQIGDINKRVDEVEGKHQELALKVAKNSAIGGMVSGTLVSVAIDLIKKAL